jgi:hypothetical protein
MRQNSEKHKVSWQPLKNAHKYTKSGFFVDLKARVRNKFFAKAQSII